MKSSVKFIVKGVLFYPLIAAAVITGAVFIPVYFLFEKLESW